MIRIEILLALLSFLTLVITSEDENPLARGYGNRINWVKFEDSAALAKSTSKPIFLLIHKTWCGACQNLKPKLADSLKFQEMSEHFVMVNVVDDEEPRESAYMPDGGYIPRILFLDSDNNVKPELYNMNGNAKYKYYYSDSDQVISGMENTLRVLTNYKTPINTDNDDDSLTVNGEDEIEKLEAISSDNEL